MDVSVVIVNYNVREFLRGALESVKRSFAFGGVTGEIIVVDNASRDGSQEMLRTDFPDVILHALDTNLGFGKANNIAMREAKGDYILILNPDTILGEDTLKVMVEFMRTDPECGLSGCKLLNADGSFQVSCRRGFPTPWASFTKLFGLSTVFPNSPLFARYNLTYLPTDKTYEVDALAGAFMLLSKEAFIETKGFDEDFFMYGEDLDLCYRVKKAGFTVMYVHTTSTIHFKGESTRRSTLNEVKVFYEAMHIFVRKHYGTSPMFTVMLRLGIFFRSLVAMVRKYRGAVSLAIMDILVAIVSILAVSYIQYDDMFGLPPIDYPWVFIVPPLVFLLALSVSGAYQADNRRRAKPVVFAMPLAVIVLSSLTYFFKEFTSSRSLVLMISGSSSVLFLLNRAIFRLFERIRYGGEGSARPRMHRTLIAGTGNESVRIGRLLQSSGFLRRYDLIGFIGEDLMHTGEMILPNAPVRGDLATLGKTIREENINEVIFPSDAFSYTEMLLAMQRVSDDVSTREVSFNVVPKASDVLLSRSKIEVIAPPASQNGESLAVMPLEYNIQRISHRAAKRVLDIILAIIALPFALFSKRGAMSKLGKVLSGKLSIVGIRSVEARSASLAKEGVLSLADISTNHDSLSPRPEDIEQINLYYARHHTIGMDIEILLRSIFARNKR